MKEPQAVAPKPAMDPIDGLWSGYRLKFALYWLALASGISSTVLICLRLFIEGPSSLLHAPGVYELLTIAFAIPSAVLPLAVLHSRLRTIICTISFFLLLTSLSFAWSAAMHTSRLLGLWGSDQGEREVYLWHDFSLVCIRISLCLWLITPAYPALIYIFHMSRPLDTIKHSSWEHSLRRKPYLPWLGPIARFSSKLVSVCYTSNWCSHSTQSQRLSHRTHHVIHLISEISMLTLSLSESEYTISLGVSIGFISACIGFFSSLSSRKLIKPWLRVHILMLAEMADILSILLGLLVVGVEVAALLFDDTETSIVVWNILCFGIISTAIRINAALHIYVQFCHELWVWLHSHVIGQLPNEELADENEKRPSVAGYDTSSSTKFIRASKRISAKKSPRAHCASATRRAVVFIVFVIITIIAVGLWLMPDVNDTFHSREEICLIQSFVSVAKCNLGPSPLPPPPHQESFGSSNNFNIESSANNNNPPKNIIGHMYRIYVNTTTVTPPPQISSMLRKCLKNEPGNSMYCYVNPNTRHVFAQKPKFPAGLCAGIAILTLITALSGAMSVRTFVLWAFDSRS